MARDQGLIPVLDLGTARQADGSFSADFIEQLRYATHNVGFFQITGYGAAPGQPEQLLDTIRRFFSLPLEERLKLDNRLSPHFRCYTRMGTEVTQGKADAREQIDYSPERQPVRDYPEDQPFWLLQGPNLWPDESFPELRPVAMAWAELMSLVGMELLRGIAVSLQLPEDYFDEPFQGSPAWMGKLVHYVGGVVEAAGDQGVGSHADYGFVTLLLQDDVGGLEVLPPGAAAWVPVEPLPGALVVNLGEMLEVATEGYLAATIHRVQAPPPGVDRYSVPFFWSPRLDAVIHPVPLPPELKAAARGITDDPANPLLASFGMNMLKGRMRAHPDVTERHYPELLKS
ncbi:isopenicillin N synthase-like dioxygenase [Pseudarthrobacter oxydans]|uniref:Isopenicillin N synthase-like dioxygenase n=1 Tax=Pseudarthrobacter oxydans TaxID=1671 RepID=A0AAW8N9U0_PSEOX|nr:2-oxoglutarate and iron-dependent oxygenase domain-containing protein [Pseudarthrobacter oxydans]MDR6792720.1 isopenicillin N synthase-like dioxygenase [Pseudarthrobacter oxydans]MDR7164022.1 isopenicillin N synthase-like dioxygenase [Pseudarthrobacter oxydans]